MTEKPSSYQDILDIPQKFPTSKDKEKYIVETIIPAMDQRRNRTNHLTAEEIAEKLWAAPASKKPGEEHELALATVHNKGELLTVDEALEIADVMYYYLQPNAPQEADREKLDQYLLITLGDVSLALDFTIIKYSTRLKYGDMDDYKTIESEVMQDFFKMRGLPESLVQAN